MSKKNEMDKSLWKAHIAFRRICNCAGKDDIDQNTAIVFKTIAAFISEHHMAGMDSTKELNKVLAKWSEVKKNAGDNSGDNPTNRAKDTTVLDL